MYEFYSTLTHRTGVVGYLFFHSLRVHLNSELPELLLNFADFPSNFVASCAQTDMFFFFAWEFVLIIESHMLEK